MVKLTILLLTGLSNQFEPSMVFDPSEFEGPKFDYIYFLNFKSDL